MASAPRVLDQAYVPQSSAEKGEPIIRSPPMSARSSATSPNTSPKQEPLKPFNMMSQREQARFLLGSRRRKSTISKKTHKQRRKTLKRRAK